MTTNFSHTAAYIWSLADLLRGDFKQSQYGRIILPFTILRRLECVLEARKPAVLEQIEKLKTMPTLEEAAREKFLLRAAAESFYNVSPMDLSKLGSSDIKSNLLTYVDSFSKDAREIFEHFKFGESSSGFQDLLWENVGFSAQPGIYLGTIANFRVPVPPIEEQAKIRQEVEIKTTTLNVLEDKARSSVGLMQERRTALISAAVTGKIDVRDWKALDAATEAEAA